ncbi:CCA tRNA nucleotidyltransferase [Enterococcus cecorum]|uniref:CCA tRNA nucleotidyltransferase n=1 Tax=Enterococcus cecorum TaxID=44008 RepID=UPI001FAC544D|nr:CCA tRNA nucleotidyltransferase [Enterococcus cecorum]MCJ0538173.1 CCA tRNA nucleotidyltransferase [Enterococcus cecorum]MCJ0545492.1 CCA tRNA nucleotidyltransferase [Enterococcus cecorum]MCJ0549578.1 CCA tRNA nucleotidyltransferase [Enterococcus cecorum]MCJ0569016.1 CCA tRNA nucleotidyltransferase [Enterococcus cecorum]
MRINNLPQEFKKALPVIGKLNQAGYEAYFVGGSVRDCILNLPIHDVDIATSAFPAEIKEVFEKTIDVGIEHGTVLVLHQDESYEITTFRTESTYQDYRRPDHVDFVRSLEEDLKRRDFTINALALNAQGQIIDLFHGLEDLQNKRLKAVGIAAERFQEDALRMIRGLRFVSQLGFDLEEQTQAAITIHAPLLSKISVERICIEFEKLLLGQNAQQAFQLFITTDCFKYCPQLADKQHFLQQMSEILRFPIQDLSVAWCLLIDQLEIAIKHQKAFLKEWKLSNQRIHEVLLLREALEIIKQRPLDVLDYYQLNETCLTQLFYIAPFYDLALSKESLLEHYRSLVIHSLKDLAINGNDLMQALNRRGGLWLKETLAQCERAVLLKEVANEREALLNYAQEFVNLRNKTAD